jgi:L,D-peptidoglycan transpeptidase YkuD (ErfK/YbiS/YcfS/YnhG family)
VTLFTADVAAGTVTGLGETLAASFGRSGACPAAAKREGDGMTPLGTWLIRAALLRPDRLPAPATRLPWRWLRAHDGWSDDPADPHYNRPVALPHLHRHEQLWRDDGVYDIIIVLGHNDSPPLPGLGSAIFWHCQAADGRPTEGCVAIDRSALARWLAAMAPGDALAITA